MTFNIMTFSIMTLSITILCQYAECYARFRVIIVMVSVVMLSV
jgi:hypothetical protein